MRNLLLILVLLSSTMVVAQKNNFSIGANTSFLYNKIIGGVEITQWKISKQKLYVPFLTIKINYGLLGYKTYQMQPKNVIVKKTSISISNSNQLPSGSSLPKDINSNYQGFYYNSLEKVILTGIDISLIKEFKINSLFFFGIGSGWNHAKNIGYVLWYNPLINNTIKTNSNFSFNTISVLSNFGVSYTLSNHLLLKSSIQFYFFIPIKNRKQTFSFPSSMPNVGVESDLSISINYLF